MPYEETRRRFGFLPGVPILLADGQAWIVPAPAPERASGREQGGAFESLVADPLYLDLLRIVAVAEDQAELLRSELALIIHLLGVNYDLETDDYPRLLGFEPGSPALIHAQQAFHELARGHLRWIRGRFASAEPTAGPRMRQSWSSTSLKRFLVRLGQRLGVRGVRLTLSRCSRS